MYKLEKNSDWNDYFVSAFNEFLNNLYKWHTILSLLCLKCQMIQPTSNKYSYFFSWKFEVAFTKEDFNNQLNSFNAIQI